MNHKKKYSKTRVLFIIHCLLIPIVSFAIFYIYVNYSSIVMAFTNRQGEFTTEHFVRFFKEVSMKGADFNTAIRNTLLTFGITLLTYPLKVMVSYFIYKKVPFYGFYRIMFFLPGIIFSVAQALIFARIVSPTGEVAKAVGDMLNLGYAPDLLADSRYANTVVILHMLWLGFPGDLIIWGGTLARIPGDVLESAQIDGASWWTEFTRIIVPLVWPTVSLQMILMFCGIFGASGSVFLLTKGAYGTETIASWMYKILEEHAGTYQTSNIFNYLSASGLVFTTIAITISLIIRKYIDNAFEDVDF